MRAAIYARVSTADQNCEMQLKELRKYCSRRGWTFTREYVDTDSLRGTRDAEVERGDVPWDNLHGSGLTDQGFIEARNRRRAQPLRVQS